MRSRFNNFYTTNSTYGSFYEDIKNQVKQDQEQQRRQSNQYEYSHPNYSNNYHNNNNSNANTINRAKTPILPLHDSSIVGSISSSLTGLINLGNTCYINTSLQNLIHCTPFIARFLEVSNNILQRKTNSTPISEAFYELLLQIYDNNNNSQEDYINPGSFVEKFTSLHNQFYGNQEHDTQEFCRFLLQDFNCELNQVTNPSIYKKEMAYDRDKKKMFKNYKNDCHTKENSIITDTFIGYFSFEYNCECGFKEFSFSQFLDLPVQMNSGINGFDLFQMLQNNFYKKSYVDMGENCRFCKRTSKKEEIMRVAYLPQVLIISLQRINPKNGMKNEAPVRFYEGLDLREIIDAEISDGSSTKYNLFAVTNHIGEINTGHYFSYIKIDKNWYCFEDSKVYKIGYQINMRSNEVYTLFYIRSNVK
jgi:ubiquitin C-terminal hydrolase